MLNNSKIKIGAIIQARMGSTRLPGKILLSLGNSTVLASVINRVKNSGLINDIIVATSENRIDDLVQLEAIKNNVHVFRGSEENVLSRIEKWKSFFLKIKI